MLRVKWTTRYARDPSAHTLVHVCTAQLTACALRLLFSSQGFLPLHWAVNQDAPNLEVVRKLIKIFPAGPGMPSNSGNLPLHYCVSRARPSLPVIKALFNAYPEAVRSGCEDGYLPLHRFLNRPIVDLDALRQLINYFPDALLAKSSSRGQTPLHVALDNHAPDPLAVELLLQVCPSAAAVVDADRYLPLHQCLDCAEPNYALALQLLALQPQAASAATKEEMLPLHLLVGTNSDPTHEHTSREDNNGNNAPNEAVAFVTALLQAYPQALVTTVKDIVPAMDGVALADPESWSGEWVESYWSPLTRARDRGLTGLVQLFMSFQQQQEDRERREKERQQQDEERRVREQLQQQQQQRVPSRESAPTPMQVPPAVTITPLQQPQQLQQTPTYNQEGRASPAVPPLVGLPGSPAIAQTKSLQQMQQQNHGQGQGSPSEIIPFHQDFRQNNASAGAAVPVKTQPLNNNNNNNNSNGGANNYSGVNPIRGDSAGRVRRVGSDDYDAAAEEDQQAMSSNRSRGSRAAPASRVPPHILKAQNAARASSAGGSQSGDSRASSTEKDRQQRAQQQQYLQQQYQRQQQGGHQVAWGNRSTDGSDFGGPGADLMMESVMDMQSHYSRHSAAERGNNGRDTTPIRQGMNAAGQGARGLNEGSVHSAHSDVSISQLIQNQLARNASNDAAPNNSKAPPPGPIPASLLQAAENNALRLAKAQQESQQPAVRKPRIGGSSQSPQKVSRAHRSGGNNTHNNNDQANNNENFVNEPPRMAATVGAAPAQSRAEEFDSDVHDRLRVGTAPVYGEREKNKFTQPRVVGFGSNSAWSNGEDTAEDSTGPDNNAVIPAGSQNNSNNAALTAKQQRLLQAQQSYMRRSAAGGAKPNPSSNPNGGLSSNNSSSGSLLPAGLKLKPGANTGTGEGVSSGGGLLGGFHNRSAPSNSNHTSEVMKSLGGKIRIHPVSSASRQAQQGIGGHGQGSEEMV